MLQFGFKASVAACKPELTEGCCHKQHIWKSVAKVTQGGEENFGRVRDFEFKVKVKCSYEA